MTDKMKNEGKVKKSFALEKDYVLGMVKITSPDGRLIAREILPLTGSCTQMVKNLAIYAAAVITQRATAGKTPEEGEVAAAAVLRAIGQGNWTPGKVKKSALEKALEVLGHVPSADELRMLTALFGDKPIADTDDGDDDTEEGGNND
jgi:hypothetical protein